MTKEQVIAYLGETLSDLLDRTVSLDASTQVKDIEGWDSLTAMTFMVLIEKDLNVELSTDEISSFENIGALADRIISKRGDPVV